ncbi:hypothetical protein PCIT_a4170 [Pseudoalteromonas citrea]|uniref:DUF3325 domain-containing protein n=2 Tax=Pseudoalteromonas citrea TaxID=43655 RepID=A0AAD4FRV2_9GAMM|nr:hypothetical protein PCIT_a4170 [Pseudoalteromonas citrea]
MFIVGAILLILIGLFHSYLGERYILIRLFRRDNLPKLLGSDWFTKRVIRFAWHLTTIAWWGFALILVVLSMPSVNIYSQITSIIGVVFFLSGCVSFVFSHGKHLSWVVFFTIAATSFFGSAYN